MIEALEPLSDLPGVRLVMLVTHDGMPIAVPGRRPEGPDGREDPHGPQQPENPEALAAMASGWLSEVAQAVAPLSWAAPKRIVLKAARGTLVLQRTRSAILLAILARGMAPEDVRLSMDGTIARIERSLRSMGRTTGSSVAVDEPPGALPSTRSATRQTPASTEAGRSGNRTNPAGN